MDQVLKPIAQLAARFSRLPGIGSKSALRLAYFVVDQPEEEVTALSDALREVKEKVHYCALCGNYAEGELCAICENPKRTDAVICVVQDSNFIYSNIDLPFSDVQGMIAYAKEHPGELTLSLQSVSGIDAVSAQ